MNYFIDSDAQHPTSQKVTLKRRNHTPRKDSSLQIKRQALCLRKVFLLYTLYIVFLLYEEIVSVVLTI